MLSPTRYEVVPNVPTVREAGFPQLESVNWGGFVAHAATPTSAVARLNAETVKALNLPEVRGQLRTRDIMATPGIPEEFAALIKSEAERYRQIIRDANVRVE
jgi:tripartite-type tricarboxylate transporter receptor subunit TctC